MKSLGRLFVVTGICLLVIASSLFAADFPVASAPHWTTTAYFVAKADASAPVTISIPQYLTAPRQVVVPVGGVASALLTLPGGYGTMTFPDSVDAFVQLNYDGDTKSSYPLSAISAYKSHRFAPIVADGSTQTTVTMLCSSVTPVTLTPDNGSGERGSHEYTTCVPPASQYVVQQHVAAGSLDFAVGNIGFDDGSAWAAIYAFVTVGKPDRDAFQAK
jgi:hypothetical protein